MEWYDYANLIELFIASGKDQLKNRKLVGPEIEAAKLEAQAIAFAEKEDYSGAIQLLQKGTGIAPNYPSPFNNLAQIYRLQKRNDLALDALSKAIELCNDDFPQVKKQAYAQRGWLRYGEEKTEEAAADFEAASRLGCAESAKMVVRCNPYARLCSSIMQEMLNKLYYSKPE